MIYLMTIIEMTTCCLYYNILFNNDYKKNLFIKCILSIVLATIFFYLPESNNSLIRISIFIFQGFIISIIDKKEGFITIIEIGLSSVIVCAIELIFGTVTFMILNGNQINDEYIVIIFIMTFILAAVLINQFNDKININIEMFLSNHRLLCILIINVLVFILFLVISVDEAMYINGVYFEYFLLGLILVLANTYCYKNLYKDLQLKRELEINAQYQYVIDELLDKFRANEHEYKNHLNTLRGMIEFSDDECLKENVNNYVANVRSKDIYSKLMYIKSTILKAILYNNIRECEEKGITFNYNIICDFDEIPLDNTEQSVLLNNLLNNAIEAVSYLPEKYINLKIIQGINYKIIIENNIAPGTVINQEEMFKKGVSSKGEGRGFGLYNIKKIVEKYKGTI